MQTKRGRARRALTPAAVAALVMGSLVAIVATPEIAHAAAITVDTTDDELNSDGDCSLREAIEAANTNTAVDNCVQGSGPDTITLPAGTYTLALSETDDNNQDNENANQTGDLDVTSEIDIVGAGAGSTIIETDGFTASNANRAFHVLGGADLGLTDLTVRNGGSASFDSGGGGILSDGTLTVTDSTISNNTTAGIRNGGGIHSGGTLTVTDSTITDNTAQDGGGIRSEGGTTVTGSTISNNTSGRNGGAIDNPGTLTVIGSTISNNTADTSGGGIRSVGTATVSNSTISGNTADADGVGGGTGGGLEAEDGTWVNVTVTNNSGGGNGGVAGIDSSGTATLKNSIVAGNVNGAECAEVVADAHNLFETGGDGCPVGASDVTAADPLLGALADNGGGTDTHMPLDGSAAIDNADNTTCAAAPVDALDQRGATRPLDGGAATCDIGAVETGININTTDDELNSDGDCSLREAVEAANTDTAVDACAPGSGADTITLPAGTYTLDINEIDNNPFDNEHANEEGDLDITSEIDIVGDGAGSTFIEANGFNIDNPNRALHVLGSGDLGLTDLTVRNGGGALFASDGGGVFNGGALTVTDSTISNNTADGDGGGIWNDGTLTVTDSTISNNTAGHDGGGIWNNRTLTVTDSTISNNTADGDGGGIAAALFAASTAVSNSTISGNTADDDGDGDGTGGGLHGASDTWVNVTVTGNSGGGAGGVAGIDSDGTTTLKNSIVAGNVPGAQCADVVADAHNLFETGGGGCPVGASDVTATDPLLGALADNGGGTDTHMPLDGSPAIDNADNTTCAAAPVDDLDQRGVTRPLDGDGDAVATCDIGAVETASIPALSVSDVEVAEDAGPAVFTVSINQTSSSAVSVDVDTNAGSAKAGADFTAVAATATIPAGGTSTTVSVSIVDDTDDEPDETFTLTLSDPVNAGIADGTGVGTITDDDPPAADDPPVSDDPSVTGVKVADAFGGVFVFGDGAFHGSIPGLRAGTAGTAGVGAAAASIPDGVRFVDIVAVDGGYLLLDEFGGVFAFGADFHGSIPGLRAAGMTTAPSSVRFVAIAAVEGGYLLLDEHGGVFAFGNADFHGSIPGLATPGATGPTSVRFVALAAGPDGSYYLLNEFGGIHVFGPAPFPGSIPSLLAAGTIDIPTGLRFVDFGVSPDGTSVWVLDEFGGVWSVGNATFFGSIPGALGRGLPAVGIDLHLE